MFMMRKSNNLFNQSSANVKKQAHNASRLIIYYKYKQYFYNLLDRIQKNY